MSDPSNTPRVILNTPAIPFSPLITFLLLFPNANGSDNKNVIIDIDTIVPRPKSDMNNIPFNVLFIEGKRISITAALPAKL